MENTECVKLNTNFEKSVLNNNSNFICEDETDESEDLPHEKISSKTENESNSCENPVKSLRSPLLFNNCKSLTPKKTNIFNEVGENCLKNDKTVPTYSESLSKNFDSDNSEKSTKYNQTSEVRRGKRKRKTYIYAESDVSTPPSEPEEKKCLRTRKKKYACVICGKKFFNAKILESHIDSHGGNKRFKCEICGKEYGWQSSYQNHMVTHSGGDSHKCSTCGKVLCNNSTLQRHIERVHLKPMKNFSCDICGRNFLYSYELKYHKENHFTKKQFICEFCGKSVSTKNDLVSHVRTHTGEKPFVCDVCGKGFTWKSLMKQHMMLHYDGNSFQCEICGKQYSARRSLARHSRLHAEERPYKCTMCSKTFRSPSAMASHKDFHLGVKRHRCEYCGKSFLSDSNMHKHKKRHLGVKDQICEICQKAFITKQELQMHMKSHNRCPKSSRGRKKATA